VSLMTDETITGLKTFATPFTPGTDRWLAVWKGDGGDFTINSLSGMYLGNHQIHMVTAGYSDLDAVNVSQLKSSVTSNCIQCNITGSQNQPLQISAIVGSVTYTWTINQVEGGIPSINSDLSATLFYKSNGEYKLTIYGCSAKIGSASTGTRICSWNIGSYNVTSCFFTSIQVYPPNYFGSTNAYCTSAYCHMSPTSPNVQLYTVKDITFNTDVYVGYGFTLEGNLV
jgi:hypothetical protein